MVHFAIESSFTMFFLLFAFSYSTWADHILIYGLLKSSIFSRFKHIISKIRTFIILKRRSFKVTCSATASFQLRSERSWVKNHTKSSKHMLIPTSDPWLLPTIIVYSIQSWHVVAYTLISYWSLYSGSTAPVSSGRIFTVFVLLTWG